MWVGYIFLVIIKFAARMRMIYIIVCATLTQRETTKQYLR